MMSESKPLRSLLRPETFPPYKNPITEYFSLAAVASYLDVYVFMSQTEGATLLSALSLALSACGAPWPAFVPVHDALRNAWQGVAALAGASVFFDSDSVHTGAPPPHLLQVRRTLQGVQGSGMK